MTEDMSCTARKRCNILNTDRLDSIEDVWLPVLVPVRTNTEVDFTRVLVGLEGLGHTLSRSHESSRHTCTPFKAYRELGREDQQERHSTSK